MKTNQLTDLALDWAVASALGLCPQYYPKLVNQPEGGVLIDAYDGNGCLILVLLPSYSTDWSQGGPIIAGHITTYQKRDGYFYTSIHRPDASDCFWAYGDTLLISAMRTYALSVLGPDVEIPAELMGAL
ncbi:MAG: phage protein NinX family protein [Candidatus Nanopelagicales bacterium]